MMVPAIGMVDPNVAPATVLVPMAAIKDTVAPVPTLTMVPTTAPAPAPAASGGMTAASLLGLKWCWYGLHSFGWNDQEYADRIFSYAQLNDSHVEHPSVAAGIEGIRWKFVIADCTSNKDRDQETVWGLVYALLIFLPSGLKQLSPLYRRSCSSSGLVS